MNDWQNNTVAELIHGPCDGAEIVLPSGDKVVEVIEVPILVELTTDWEKEWYERLERPLLKPPIRLGIYRRDGGTLRFHSGAPATVKFKYQETRDDKEPVV